MNQEQKNERQKKKEKYEFIKTLIASGLLGTTAALGALSFYHSETIGKFKPFLSKEDKETKYKVTTLVESKDNDKKTFEYLYGINYSKIAAFKTYNELANKNEYYFYDISLLKEEQINYVYSYLDKLNKNDLQAIRGYIIAEECLDITRYNIGDAKFFDSNDQYEIKIITKTIDKEDMKEFEIEDLSFYYYEDGLIIGFGICGGAMLAIPGYTMTKLIKEKNQKKKLKTK